MNLEYFDEYFYDDFDCCVDITRPVMWWRPRLKHYEIKNWTWDQITNHKNVFPAWPNIEKTLKMNEEIRRYKNEQSRRD